MIRSHCDIAMRIASILGSAILILPCASAAVDSTDSPVYVPSAPQAAPLRAIEPYQNDAGYRIAVDTPASAPAAEPPPQPNVGKPFDREITAAARDLSGPTSLDAGAYPNLGLTCTV